MTLNVARAQSNNKHTPGCGFSLVTGCRQEPTTHPLVSRLPLVMPAQYWPFLLVVALGISRSRDQFVCVSVTMRAVLINVTSIIVSVSPVKPAVHFARICRTPHYVFVPLFCVKTDYRTVCTSFVCSLRNIYKSVSKLTALFRLILFLVCLLVS